MEAHRCKRPTGSRYVVRSTCYFSCRSAGFQLRPEPQIAVVPRRADLSTRERVAHCAFRFHPVGAIAEAAVGEEGAEFGKAAVELSGVERPHADFAQARGVGEVAAFGAGQRMEVATDSRVAAL